MSKFEKYYDFTQQQCRQNNPSAEGLNNYLNRTIRFCNVEIYRHKESDDILKILSLKQDLEFLHSLKQ